MGAQSQVCGCEELSVSADCLYSRMKGETPVNSTMSIGQARKMVEQLKIEASLCRIKVGATLAPISPSGLSCGFAIPSPPPSPQEKMLLFLTP